MGSIKSFEDVVVWQKAFVLAKEVYTITKKFPSDERYGLTSQIRRSVVSVGSNIVEGFGRFGFKDGLSFYNIANASLEEFKFQLMLSKDLGYCSKEEYLVIKNKSDEVGRMLRGWIKGHYNNNYKI